MSTNGSDLWISIEIRALLSSPCSYLANYGSGHWRREEDDNNGPDQHQDSCLVSSSHSHSSLANYGSKSPEKRKKTAAIPEGGSLIMEGDILGTGLEKIPLIPQKRSELSRNGRIIAVNDTDNPQLFHRIWVEAKYTFVLLLAWALSSVGSEAQQRPSYNVLDFNATGDGNTDDTKAFLAAWEETCNNEGWPILIIPGGRTFLLKQVRFNGSCKSPIKIQMDGNIVAPNYIWTSEEDNLVTFYSVNNLTLDGNGQIDGKGAIWWTCYTQKILAFALCNNLSVRNIHLTNSADKHMTVYRCSQVHVHNISIAAPGDSPNTDGITMAISDHVYISNCSIQSGDDCVSILSYTTDVNITDITCGPGHGVRYNLQMHNHEYACLCWLSTRQLLFSDTLD
uniref:Pectate lyase superfamily protein domain-containing protein n=1 Tax=Oryza punctata TaxID=4537 RepID=A0A0E0JEP4_ORYPU